MQPATVSPGSMDRSAKQHLRNRFRKNRRGLRSRFHKKLSRRIVLHLQEILGEGPGSLPLKILFYWPIHSEVDLRLLPLLCSTNTYYLPRSASPGELEIAYYQSGQKLVEDSNGIPAPDLSAVCIPAHELDLILVPGVAFDGKGSRLGYGGGYYDRLLEKNTLPTLGIGFHFQVQKEPLPTGKTDCSVDAYLTENGIVRIKNSFPYGNRA